LADDEPAVLILEISARDRWIADLRTRRGLQVRISLDVSNMDML